jgi:hypothetical protein
MREFYELATLHCPLLAVAQVAKAARDWISAPETGGDLLGCWRSEIGPLGHLLILRRFETAGDLAQERQRALLSANPFNAGAVITSVEMDSYQPFPFLPPMQRHARDAITEFRTYRLKPGGLVATLAGWEAAIEPARAYTAHLRINMYATDGPPRITHIWGFNSLAERAALRSAAYGAGLWPPEGGPEAILEATSVIALPEAA